MGETGLFYSSVIDPMLKGMRKKVTAEVRKGETVIDIACGTGAQVFQLSRKAGQIVGVDLSESMIKFANKKCKKQSILNAEFKLADATNLTVFADREFDVAIMSLALHQFSPELYIPILSEMKRVAKRIVIVDYAVPLPNNFAGYASKIIEYLAGREHNHCFRSYYKAGGLVAILAQNGLRINRHNFFGGGAFMLVSCSASK